MESISLHITPLVINSLGVDTHTHMYRRLHKNNFKKPGAPATGQRMPDLKIINCYYNAITAKKSIQKV